MPLFNLLNDYTNGVSGSTSLTTASNIIGATLSIAPSTNATADIGLAKVGRIGFNNYAGFSHMNFASSTGYALLQTETGETKLNAQTNQNILFRIGNVQSATLYQNGFFGVGIRQPSYPLTVQSPWNSAANSFSIWCDHGLYVGTTITSASDSRIKTNIQDLHDGDALIKIRKLKPKTYEYIDKKRGSHTVVGFIAQNIRDDMPEAHKYSTELIPNIYSSGIFSAGILTLTKSTTLLERDETNILFPLIMYNSENEKLTTTITNIIDDYNIMVEVVKNDTGDNLTISDNVFVYGQLVSNFNTIVKSHIFTTNVAATQELDRLLTAEKLKTSIMQEQINDMLNRIIALESA